MDRRVFFRILTATSAGALATDCGTPPGRLMPLLVPEREIVPGEERWHPAVCTGCGAGCGTLVRVMDGERVVVRNGEQWRERIATIKKIEGNPLDPVSGGRRLGRSRIPRASSTGGHARFLRQIGQRPQSELHLIDSATLGGRR
jgi:anaerobic selenocysteine-containing dehydrogenase